MSTFIDNVDKAIADGAVVKTETTNVTIEPDENVRYWIRENNRSERFLDECFTYPTIEYLGRVFGLGSFIVSEVTNGVEGKRTILAAPHTAVISNPSDPMLQFFRYSQLAPHLQEISKPFGILAENLVNTLPRNPERTAALRKLMEAKDCAVRALIYEDGTV